MTQSIFLWSFYERRSSKNRRLLWSKCLKRSTQPTLPYLPLALRASQFVHTSTTTSETWNASFKEISRTSELKVMENRITSAHFQIVYPNSQAYTSDRIVGIGIQVNSWTLPWIPRLDRNYSLENYRNLSRNKSHLPDYGKPWSILFVCLFICVCMCAWMHIMAHVWRSQNKPELVLSSTLWVPGTYSGQEASWQDLTHWATSGAQIVHYELQVPSGCLILQLKLLCFS